MNNFPRPFALQRGRLSTWAMAKRGRGTFLFMNKTENFSTAIHEAAHAVCADYFRIPAYPEVTPGGRSVLFPSDPPTPYAGVCHMSDPVTKFQAAVVSWAGPMGEAMFAANVPDWFPSFKPSEKMLRDWFSMMLQQINRMSDGDARGIRGYKDQWRSCRSAFAIIRKNRARIIRLGKCLAQAQSKAEQKANEEKWRGIPRPATFPATHEDFMRLACNNDSAKFESFLVSRASLHLSNNATAEVEKVKELFGARFDDAYSMSLNLQREIYAGDFQNADTWLKAVREFQQWAGASK